MSFETEDKIIKDFIKNLSDFYYYENDISNITRTLCVSDNNFKEKFLHFFFPKLDISRIEDIKREIPDSKTGRSRVDIYISLKDEKLPYLIEVKNYDQNHHFGQYEEDYGIGIERFGYITNYECTEGKEKGYDVKTWEELYDYLSSFKDNNALIEGYLDYIKRTCNIMIYTKPMNITGLTAIPCFASTVKKILNNQEECLRTKFYRSFCYEKSIHMGFNILNEDKKKNGFAVFSLWYEKPEISIGINARAWLSEKIMNDEDSITSGSQYCEKPYKDKFWDKDDVWFDLKENKLQNFIDTDSYEIQYQILKDFLEDVLKRIKIYF